MKFNSDFTMTINGKSVTTTSKITVINPANEEIVGYAPDCSRELLDSAVGAAHSAFPSWSVVPFTARQNLLHQMASALEANVGPLSRLLTAEQGKTLSDAAMEIGGAAYWLRETAKMTLPETVNNDSSAHRSVTRHVPLGVVGAIAPWNYPIGLAAFKLASALLAGNTVVLKPSPFTPLTTLKLGELMQTVLPEGVLNVISGSDELGPWMTSHPGFAKISFTGSTATGRKVMAGAAATLKHLTLELGGNDAAIVLPDVDIQTVAKCIFWASFGNSGQICLASKRIYIHKDIYGPMKQEIVNYAKTIKMGNGTDPDVQLGPIQNRPQYERVLDLIRDAQDNGYKFLMGGMPTAQKGYFIPLTIIDNPPEHSRIVQEEQFGPVLPLIEFDNIEDAIARANATDYGLGATVWSADAAAALAVGQRLQAGTVWINEALGLSPFITFAGHKQSGLGTESGREGLLAYTVPQTIAVRQNAGTWQGVPKS
ncbi:aldehyde dehydrogenase (NAD+) [Chitinophaga niastensis]|uniref:Aldehyde dehydrogenase (NAD+) n=1 Tax=Chitinophaga niastensis TaxID=536980 RepID=A0A2P8HVY9_CHINA|nr:aldehyde dehydrogenase family protein [Chitinophaga niastensis]PSL50344.1 aldehyde dehydrogenase (NAD+) [Chitinophaga niastensis]